MYTGGLNCGFCITVTQQMHWTGSEMFHLCSVDTRSVFLNNPKSNSPAYTNHQHRALHSHFL